MMDFLSGQLLFLSSLGLVFLLPGCSIVAFLERKRGVLSPFERISSGAALSFITVGFLMIAMDWFGIPLSAPSVSIGIFTLSLVFLVPAHTGRKSDAPERVVSTIPRSFLPILIGLLVIKGLYLAPALLPSSTDLGHHLYWIEKIAHDHRIPDYEERDIVTREDGTHSIDEARPISDFIIGEHLTLSAVRMLSGRDFTTSFPVLSLFFIHILTVLSVFSLARRLFDHLPNRDSIAIWTLLFLGLLYAIAPPQMKYVEGGVVGNTFGNLLIPAIILLIVIALRERRADWLATAIFLVFGLAYTHHLSMLLFAVSLGTIGLLFLALERTHAAKTLLPPLKNPRTILTLVGCLLFLTLVHVPSYLDNSAVETVIGAPDEAKAEHQGLSFAALAETVGEPRMALGLLGLFLLAVLPSAKKNDTSAVLAGWIAPLLFLSLAPGLMRISLPSGRVANYLETPIAIAAGFAVATLIILLRERIRVPRPVGGGLLLLLVVAIAWHGSINNDAYLTGDGTRGAQALALFDTGRYLALHVPESHAIVHDHINIPGNSILKVFLLRDYNFPFYRAHLFRYDRNDREERCTLSLISAPGSKEAKDCADDLDARTFVVSDPDDSPQFVRTRLFDKVYADPYHAIFVRTEERL